MTTLLSIPTDAPFTLDQRAWLGGFLAGMAAARRNDGETTVAPTLTATIAYGTQTGNSEELAERLAGAVRGRGLGATVTSTGRARAPVRKRSRRSALSRAIEGPRDGGRENLKRRVAAGADTWRVPS